MEAGCDLLVRVPPRGGQNQTRPPGQGLWAGRRTRKAYQFGFLPAIELDEVSDPGHSPILAVS